MTVLGLDSNLLLGLYDAQLAQSQASFTSRQASIASGRSAPSDQVDVEPPWGVGADRRSDEEERARALSGRSVIDTNDSLFGGAPLDDQNLFKIWSALNRLKTIAEYAADDTTSSLLLSSANEKFQTGLGEVREFVADATFTKLDLIASEDRKEAKSDAAIYFQEAKYKTGTIHTGAFDDPVSSLTGTETFSITVEKPNSTIVVDVNLADVSGPLNLDNIVTLINDRLDAQGVLTTFKRVKVGEPDEDGIIQGNRFGFEISGSTTETVRFSSASAEPAVYVAGVSGRGEDAAGQIVKLGGLAAASPETLFTRRLEGDGEQTTNEDGETETAAAQLEIFDSALDNHGNLYVVGTTYGDLGDQLKQGPNDVFLTKYDSTGKVVYSRLLGAKAEAAGYSVAVDSQNNVVVAGAVKSDLVNSTIDSGEDAFVTKYDSNGAEVFTYQNGPIADDQAFDVTIGANDEIIVGGQTKSRLTSSQTFGGGTDGFVFALDSTGAVQYQRQFGGTGAEKTIGVATAADGDYLVVSVEDGEGVLRKYSSTDENAAAIFEVNLGALNDGGIADITVDGNDIYIAGHTKNASFGPGGASVASAHSGGDDGFVVKLTDAGASVSADRISFIGGPGENRITGVDVYAGEAYVSGYTKDALGAASQVGSTDSFVAQVGVSGALGNVYQYSGRGGISNAASVKVDPTGSSVLDKLGLPTGNAIEPTDQVVVNNTSVRDGQFFYVSIDGGRKKKITIDADDTLRQLAFKVDNALLFSGTADVSKGGGDRLRIRAAENAKIEILSGDGDQDALAGLGLSPGVVVNTGSLLDEPDEDAETEEIETYALGIPFDIDLSTRESAEAAIKTLSDAMLEITKAHREINTDPALKALLREQSRTAGPTPDFLNAQLANYQAGLARLNGGGGGATLGLF